MTRTRHPRGWDFARKEQLALGAAGTERRRLLAEMSHNRKALEDCIRQAEVAGIGPSRIAEIADVSRNHVWKVLSGWKEKP